MPPQTDIVERTTSSLTRLVSQQQHFQQRCDETKFAMIKETINTSSTSELQRCSAPTTLMHNQPVLPDRTNDTTEESKMGGARPKICRYKKTNQYSDLSNSPNSTPFHSSVSGIGSATSISPSRKRGKSCDRLNGDDRSMNASDARSRLSRQRLPKQIVQNIIQHELLWTDISMSLDSTCTEETNSSSGCDTHNYHSSHQIPNSNISHRNTLHNGQKQPHDISILPEEKVDTIPSDSLTENLANEVENIPSRFSAASSNELSQKQYEDNVIYNSGRKLSRRGKLQRSTRIEEYSPNKSIKAHFCEIEKVDFNSDDRHENPTDNKITKSIPSNCDVDQASTRRAAMSAVSPGSFEALDNDDGDVAFIDDEIEERDFHGDLLNWLTLSDAPKQSQEEVDL